MNDLNRLDADGRVGLSPAGMVRREAILGELHGALATKRRRRVAVRAAGAAALAISVATGACLVVWPAAVPGSGGGNEIAAVPPKESEPLGSEGSNGEAASGGGRAWIAMSDRAPRVEVIGPDSGVMLRMAIAADRPSRIEVIDDMTLTRTLAAKGDNVGIARVGGKVMLVTN